MRALLRARLLVPLTVGSSSLLYFTRYPRPPDSGPPDADHVLFTQAKGAYLAQLPAQTLLRSLFVHSFCTHPRLVDFGIWIMNAREGLSVPVLDSIIRHTFFAHFCGGETREEAVQLGMTLQEQGISPLLVYSKESSDSIVDIQNTEREIVKCIQAARSLKKPAFVAVKLSGLSTDDELRQLERDVHHFVLTAPSQDLQYFQARADKILSQYPGLVGCLERLSTVAVTNQVQLVLDAEVRFQGEVDSLPTAALLSSALNAREGRVWNTHQMIFKDSVQKLGQWSGSNSIKLVRGAYLHLEPPSKVIQSKQEADDMYDRAVEQVITTSTNPLMLATHNHHSVLKAYHLLQQTQSSARRSDRIISFAQLYGMGDDITYGLVKEARNSAQSSAFSLVIIKYIPYGDLNEVLPYLIRRAEENRGMLGGSMLEREALWDEVKRRILATLGMGSTTAI